MSTFPNGNSSDQIKDDGNDGTVWCDNSQYWNNNGAIIALPVGETTIKCAVWDNSENFTIESFTLVVIEDSADEEDTDMDLIFVDSWTQHQPYDWTENQSEVPIGSTYVIHTEIQNSSPIYGAYSFSGMSTTDAALAPGAQASCYLQMIGPGGNIDTGGSKLGGNLQSGDIFDCEYLVPIVEGIPLGTYTWTLTIDAANEIGETNENNMS